METLLTQILPWSIEKLSTVEIISRVTIFLDYPSKAMQI